MSISAASNGTRLRVMRSPWGRRVDFLLLDLGVGDSQAIATQIEMRTLTEEEKCMDVNPSFSLSDSAAQELIDEMWAAGFRPARVKDNHDHLGAVQGHLNDMQRIAFGLLELPQEIKK